MIGKKPFKQRSNKQMTEKEYKEMKKRNKKLFEEENERDTRARS